MEIIVRGRSGSGKTAVAQLIAETLRLHGFTVAHESEDVRPFAEHVNVLHHVAKAGLKIQITEEQAACGK